MKLKCNCIKPKKETLKRRENYWFCYMCKWKLYDNQEDKMETKQWKYENWVYHFVAVALLIYGYFYYTIYFPTQIYEVSAINEIALSIRTLWYVGFALIVEVAGCLNMLCRK